MGWITNWPLGNIVKPYSDLTQYNEIVLYIKTKGNYKNAGSPGPLEFSLFSHCRIEDRERQFLYYQTVLPVIGKQKPTEKGGHYLFSIQLPYGGERGSRQNEISYWILKNLSDNMWVVNKVLVFFASSKYGFGKFVSMGELAALSLDPQDGKNYTFHESSGNFLY